MNDSSVGSGAEKRRNESQISTRLVFSLLSSANRPGDDGRNSPSRWKRSVSPGERRSRRVKRRGGRWEMFLFPSRRRGNRRRDLALLGASDEVGADVEPLLVEGVDGDFDLVLSEGWRDQWR